MNATTSIDCIGAVVFTDLVGFTEYTDALGDAAALDVLEAQTAMARAAVAGREGRIVKELGDGLMLWFDGAEDAVDAAVSLMSSIETARDTGDFPLAVRMGAHHGEVISRGDDVVGQTVNIAARVADLAGPGELLLSEPVVEACAHARRPPLSLIGPVTVKGVQAPIWLHRVAR